MRSGRMQAELKVLAEGVPYVMPRSTSLIDQHRAQRLTEAALKAITRFVKSGLAGDEGAVGEAEQCIALLTEYDNALRSRCDTISAAAVDLAGEIEIDSVSDLVKDDDDLRSSRQKMSFNIKSLRLAPFSSSRRKRRSSKEEIQSYIRLGMFPEEVVMVHVQEERLSNALVHRWQRLLYNVVLRQNDVRGALKGSKYWRIRRFRLTLAVLYCLATTAWILAFHMTQENAASSKTGDEIRANQNVYASAILDTLVDILVVSPLFLFIRMVIVPSIADRLLRNAIETALAQINTCVKSEADTTLVALPAVLKAKRKFLNAYQPNGELDAPEVAHDAAEEAHDATIVRPEKWDMHIDDESGHPYYHNTTTGETTWDAPLEPNDTEAPRPNESGFVDTEEHIDADVALGYPPLREHNGTAQCEMQNDLAVSDALAAADTHTSPHGDHKERWHVGGGATKPAPWSTIMLGKKWAGTRRAVVKSQVQQAFDDHDIELPGLYSDADAPGEEGDMTVASTNNPMHM